MRWRTRDVGAQPYIGWCDGAGDPSAVRLVSFHADRGASDRHAAASS